MDEATALGQWQWLASGESVETVPGKKARHGNALPVADR